MGSLLTLKYKKPCKTIFETVTDRQIHWTKLCRDLTKNKENICLIVTVLCNKLRKVTNALAFFWTCSILNYFFKAWTEKSRNLSEWCGFRGPEARVFQATLRLRSFSGCLYKKKVLHGIWAMKTYSMYLLTIFSMYFRKVIQGKSLLPFGSVT